MKQMVMIFRQALRRTPDWPARQALTLRQPCDTRRCAVVGGRARESRAGYSASVMQR
ncbi:hypothetical protein [Candidatus Pantoea deserta]|uniref:hypothetical protein n=1 Tax=Candidatus Pantoea deserta TaxID=1869313 RepID=UPI00131A1251|nr:hypothetical protein [Pantoea deserta]